MSELIDSGRAVDIVTLANELSRYKEVESVGGVAYLASLTEGLPRRPVIEDYIRIVKDKSMLRRLMGICSAAIARAADQSEDAIGVLDETESQLLEVSQVRPHARACSHSTSLSATPSAASTTSTSTAAKLPAWPPVLPTSTA